MQKLRIDTRHAVYDNDLQYRFDINIKRLQSTREYRLASGYVSYAG